MKLKKSDFVRICRKSEMRAQEWGVILPDKYEDLSVDWTGCLIFKPNHYEDAVDRQSTFVLPKVGLASFINEFREGTVDFLVGILPNPEKIEVEDD